MALDTLLDADWRAAINFEPRKNAQSPTILLLHYTGTKTAEHALDWLCTPESRVSCHYLIDENGRIIQMVREDMRAWHAGHAFWAGERDINSASIGIEIHNPGHDAGYPDFGEAQMQAVEALCRDIIERHNIKPHRVLAHSDVAPHRKCDPGEKFDWKRLASAGIGHWVEPSPFEDDAGFGVGDQHPEIQRFQKQLAAYGYEVEPTGQYCNQTEIVTAAFQRHFRPGLVNGRAERSTIDTLDRLIDALRV